MPKPSPKQGRPVTGKAGSLTRQMNRLNRWREQFNPLRGLDIQRAIWLLECFNRGEMADLQWTYFHIEQTDADLMALIERRTSAIQEMDWTIKLIPAPKRQKTFDQVLAEEQAAALRESYDRIDNLYEGIEHLSMASFRGFSLLELQALKNPWCDHLGVIDQWNCVRDGLRGGWKYNPEAQITSFENLPEANSLPDDLLIQRSLARHINRIALIKFIRSNMGEKDWSAFIEIYGIPSGIVTMPPNIPVGQESAYEDAAEAVAQGGSGALPAGSDYKPNDQPRGINPFKDFLGYLTEKLVLAGTGGLLTMLAQSGSGTLAGNAHADTFKSIAKSEGRKISEVFQQQRDRALLDLNFPGQPHLAYFEICFNEENDVADIVAHVGSLSTAGYQVSAEQVQEKTGYQVTLKPPTPSPAYPGQYQPAPIANRSTNQLAANMGIDPDWLKPVDDLLAELERKAADGDLSDADFIAFYEQAVSRVPELFSQMDIESLAEFFEEGMAESLAEGIRASLKKEAQA